MKNKTMLRILFYYDWLKMAENSVLHSSRSATCRKDIEEGEEE